MSASNCGHGGGGTPKFVLRLIYNSCHKTSSWYLAFIRKRITKTTDYKDSSYLSVPGRERDSGSKNYAIRPEFAFYFA